MPLARAFETWSARCDELMAMGRAAAYLSQRGLAMAWRSWDDFLCVRELMRSAASALLSASLRRGYNTWVSWADEKLETESRIRSVLLSMTSQLRAAFNAWAEYDDAPRALLSRAGRRPPRAPRALPRGTRGSSRSRHASGYAPRWHT